METIYVLRLQRGKYYVGKTGRSVEERYDEHRRGHGSAWTRLYAPVDFQEILESTSPFDEDRTVKEYMSEFGVNNVRGGSYSEIELNGETRRLLEREIRHAFGLCLNCGDRSHYRRNCPSLRDGPHDHSGRSGSSQRGGRVPSGPPHHQMRQNRPLSHGGRMPNEPARNRPMPTGQRPNGANRRAERVCERCGRTSHTVENCYANSHTLGNTCLRCGFAGHTIDNCYANRHVRGDNTCVRCGRDGHNVDACYATSSRWGDDLDDTSDDDSY
jgi:hypothetical protein